MKQMLSDLRIQHHSVLSGTGLHLCQKAETDGLALLQDLNELMFPSMAKDTPESAAAQPSLSPEKLRRQTSDGARFKSSQGGPISFVLEEPIVPTTPMVPSGPRRYEFSLGLIWLLRCNTTVLECTTSLP